MRLYEATAIKKAKLSRFANQSQLNRAESLEFKLHKATLKGINKDRHKRFVEKICQPDMIYSGGIKFFIGMYNQKTMKNG